MINYRIHLIRNGRTSAAPGKRYVGQLDLPLCQEGREELEDLRHQYLYPRVGMVYTSSLTRCVETAEILYPDTYTVESGALRDMNLGEFEGKTFEELRSRADFSLWIDNSFDNPPPGGEETMEFTQRIIDGLSIVFQRMMEERVTDVAVITHGGVIMTLLASIGLPKMPLPQWAVENGKGYTLLLTPQMWMRDHAVEVYGNLPYLRDDGDTPEF